MPVTLPCYREAGFEAIGIGQEGMVDLETFTLEGKEGKPLRTPVNKLTHAGYTFAVHQPPIGNELLGELRQISDEWLTMMHGSEKKFSLGWFEAEYIRSSAIGAVRTSAGLDERLRQRLARIPTQ